MQEPFECFLRQEEIKRVCETSDKRYIMGSPKIGKTTLVAGVVNKLQKDGVHCPIKIDWDEKDWTASWNSILSQISKFFAGKRRVGSKIAKLVEQYWEKPGEIVQFLEELHSQSKVDVVLVIDDLDKAERSYDPHSPHLSEGLTPAEVVRLGTLQGVRLVATGREAISHALRRVFDLEEWLRLPSEQHVREYVQTKLGLKSDQDRRVSLVIEWAGYHPFLLQTLLDSIPAKTEKKEIEALIRKWITSDKVQEFLKEMLTYLEAQMSKNSEIRIMLRQMLDGIVGREPLSTNERSLVQHLRDYAVADANPKSFNIPSNLMRQKLRDAVVPARPAQLAWRRFVILSIVIVPLSSGLYFVFELAEPPFDPRWAFALMSLPTLYLMLSYIWLLAYRSAYKLWLWLQQFVHRSKYNT